MKYCDVERKSIGVTSTPDAYEDARRVRASRPVDCNWFAISAEVDFVEGASRFVESEHNSRIGTPGTFAPTPRFDDGVGIPPTIPFTPHVNIADAFNNVMMVPIDASIDWEIAA